GTFEVEDAIGGDADRHVFAGIAGLHGHAGKATGKERLVGFLAALVALAGGGLRVIAIEVQEVADLDSHGRIDRAYKLVDVVVPEPKGVAHGQTPREMN